MSIPAAWHPDPLERHELRYWDGTIWTEHVSDAGVTAINPLDDYEATDEVAEGTAGTPAVTTPVPPAPTGTTSGQFDQVLATMSQQAVNRIATSAMVVGIIALVFSVIPLLGAVAGFPLGGYAVVGGIIGLLISKKSGQGRGASIAGMVLGGLALAIATVQVVVLGQFVDGFSRTL